MNPVAVVRQVSAVGGVRQGARLYFWCPGCDDLHGVGIRGDDGSAPEVEWGWDGNVERPTVNPSILVSGVQWETSSSFHKPRHRVSAGAPVCCHSYLRAGRWEFLSDSTHELAGQTVEMVPLPDWMCSK